MDLIFKRYSSPFFLVDTLILNNQFSDFIVDLINTVNEEKIYELWMHKSYTEGYNDFRKRFAINSDEKVEKVNVNKVLESSMRVLEDIQP